MQPTLSYGTVQPNLMTFRSAKLKHCTERHLPAGSRVLNACAGETHLEHGGQVVRNDIDPGIEADLHQNVETLDDHLESESFDAVVYDPPFSEHQAKATYDSTLPNPERVADVVDDLLKPGGTLVTWGFSTAILPLAYHLEHVALWNTLGNMHDWFGTVLKKPQDGESASREASQARVRPNATAPATGQVTTSGNNGAAVEMRYAPPSASSTPRRRAADWLEDVASGHTLIIGPQEYDLDATSRHLVDPRDVHRGQTLSTSVDERSLSQRFDQDSIDTTIIDVPGSHNECRPYAGESSYRITAIKRELESLLAPGATVAKVSHTATLMPDGSGFSRAFVGILGRAGANPDLIVSVDQKPSATLPGASAPERIPADVTVAPDGDIPHRYRCQDCFHSTYFHPAYSTWCPECGTATRNQCVDEGIIRPLEAPHEARVDWFDSQHTTECPIRRDDIEIAHHVDSGENDQRQQSSLAAF
jgi:hypothetical protein